MTFIALTEENGRRVLVNLAHVERVVERSTGAYVLLSQRFENQSALLACEESLDWIAERISNTVGLAS